MEIGFFLTLFLMNVATVVVVGFFFHRFLIKRIRNLMEKERKKYFDIIQDSIYVAMENERKVKQQITAFDNAVKTADERLKTFGNLRETAEAVRARQAELEERLASLLMQINEQAGRLDSFNHRVPGSIQVHGPQNFTAPQPNSDHHGFDPRIGGGYSSNPRGFTGQFAGHGPGASGFSAPVQQVHGISGQQILDVPHPQGSGPSHQGAEGFGRITGTLELSATGNDLGEVDLQTGFKNLRNEFIGDINRSIRENTGEISGILDEVDQILDDDEADLDDEIDLDAVIKRINDRVGSHPDFELKRLISEPASESRAENENRCKKIVELSARGISPGNIARMLDIPLGEVQIILRLKRHLPAGETASTRGEI